MRSILCCWLAFAVLAGTWSLGHAQPNTIYPAKVIRLIVPFAPGGGSDMIARLVAAKLSERLGKQVFVDNRPGAGGVIGTEMAAAAPPDGHTLLIVPGALTTQAALQKLPYDPVKSFAPIARLASGPFVLVVHPGVPAKSVKELIALAKQRPGKLNFVSTGVGVNAHLSAELFKMMAGIDFMIVQFKGGGPAVIDLIGGHSDAFLSSIPQVVSHIKSGKLRALGTSGAKRSVILPDVPTIAESGLSGYEANQWFGILAPAGTPAPVVDRLNKEIKSILISEDVNKILLNEGAEADYLGAAGFGSLIVQDVAKWPRVVKQANIKLE